MEISQGNNEKSSSISEISNEYLADKLVGNDIAQTFDEQTDENDQRNCEAVHGCASESTLTAVSCNAVVLFDKQQNGERKPNCTRNTAGEYQTEAYYRTDVDVNMAVSIPSTDQIVTVIQHASHIFSHEIRIQNMNNFYEQLTGRTQLIGARADDDDFLNKMERMAMEQYEEDALECRYKNAIEFVKFMQTDNIGGTEKSQDVVVHHSDNVDLIQIYEEDTDVEIKTIFPVAKEDTDVEVKTIIPVAKEDTDVEIKTIVPIAKKFEAEIVGEKVEADSLPLSQNGNDSKQDANGIENIEQLEATEAVEVKSKSVLKKLLKRLCGPVRAIYRWFRIKH